MKAQLALLLNTSYNNVKKEILIKLTEENFNLEKEINFHRESNNYVKYVKSLDKYVIDEKTIGINVCDIELYQIYKRIGGGEKRGLWSYLVKKQDYNKSRFKHDTSFEEYQTKVSKNIILHEISEKFYTPAEKDIEKYRKELFKKLKKLMPSQEFNHFNYQKYHKHDVLYAVHEKKSECAGAIELNGLSFQEKLDYLYKKKGLCPDCQKRLEEDIHTFLAK